MLILTRKVNEVIHLGDDIQVTVLSIRPGAVRLGLTAPADCKILRGELYERERVSQETMPDWMRDDQATQHMLLLVGREVPLDVIRGWPIETVQAVEEWATQVHYDASDNDVGPIPPCPRCLDGYEVTP